VEELVIALLTTAWKRPELTRVMLRYYAQVCPSWYRVIAVSEEEAKADAEDAGWHAVMVDNEPLADKHNAAALWIGAANRRVDGVVVINSDTFMSRVSLAAIANLGAWHDYLEPERIHIYDLEQGRAMRITAPRIGAGRWISLKAMKRCEWMPWTPGRTKRMDAAQRTRMESFGFELRRWTDTGMIVDVKTGENIWSYDDVASAKDVTSEVVVPSAIWSEDHFPRWLNEWMRC